MNDARQALLTRVAGSDAVDHDARGTLRVRPRDTDSTAAVLATAHREGWRVAIAGRASWQPDDTPADLVISLVALDRISALRPADLVVTAGAGTRLSVLRRAALDHATWCTLDPPGHADRTMGSIVATATTGPLRHGYGPVRDQVLGLVTVSGDGTVTRAGGTTVKNVAGFDLVKLQTGGFGGFGVITECHLRLRGLPRADTTWTATGERDRLLETARQLTDWHSEAIAIELLSPRLAGVADWLLAVRLAGGPDAVRAESDRLARAGNAEWTRLDTDRAGAFWHEHAERVLAEPLSCRAGVLVEGISDALDLITGHLGASLLSIGPGTGAIRWSGTAAAAPLITLRGQLAAREIPLTLERAPWEIRHAVGHFGAYREGVGPLVSRLRHVYDPGGRLAVPLEGTPAA